MKGRVLLGISGGVDSTYAAHALREAGYEVEGAVLKMHEYTELAEAADSARSLGIPLRVIDATERFSRTVIEDFCRAYQNALTPNPCIVCNENVKFRLLYEEARGEGFDFIATGHYARIGEQNGRYALETARDVSKDQTYMLYRLPQEILKMLLLPLGEYMKKDVSAKAASMSLAAAERAESQEICFVKGESYADYIERRCGAFSKGSFVDEEGRVLGTHNGIPRYTLGQRKGLGISASSRLFVKDMCVESGNIILSDRMPLTAEFLMDGAVFSGMSEEEVLAADDLLAKVRYQAFPVPARIIRAENGFRVRLAEEARFVTPGQSAVFYQKGRVVCGGIIQKRF